MNTRPSMQLKHPGFKRLAYGFHIATLLLVVFLFLCYDFLLVSAPFQIEYREGSELSTTATLMQGINPYIKENHPLLFNTYGILYSLVVMPFAFWFGNSLQLHRLVTGIALFSAALFIVILLIRKKVLLPYAISAGVLFLSLQFFYTTPVARPDGLGLLLFLLAALLPWGFNYSAKSLAASVIFGLLAFYTKPYFILAIAYLALYMFLFVSKKKAVLYGISAALAFTVSFSIVCAILPYYFYDTIYVNAYVAGKNWPYMLIQVGLFLVLFGGLILLAILFSDWKAGFRRLRALPKSPRPWIDIKKWDAPVLRPFLDFPSLCFFLSTFLVVMSFGQHMGAYMCYIYQLMVPFIAIWLMQVFSRREQFLVFQLPGIWFTLFLIIQLVYPKGLTFNNADFLPEWNRMSQVIAGSNKIFNSPAVVDEMIRQNKPFVDSGQNQFYFVSAVPRFAFLPPESEVLGVGESFQREITRSIKEKSYDLVMLTNGESPFIDPLLLARYYRHKESITLIMPGAYQVWLIDIWVPN